MWCSTVCSDITSRAEQWEIIMAVMLRSDVTSPWEITPLLRVTSQSVNKTFTLGPRSSLITYLNINYVTNTTGNNGQHYIHHFSTLHKTQIPSLHFTCLYSKASASQNASLEASCHLLACLSSNWSRQARNSDDECFPRQGNEMFKVNFNCNILRWRTSHVPPVQACFASWHELVHWCISVYVCLYISLWNI